MEGSYPPDHPEALKQGRRANAGRKVRPVLTVVPGAADADDPRSPDGASLLIDQIVREGARRMLAEALQAEVDAYIAQFTGERDENGRRLVVRNGSHQPREVLTIGRRGGGGRAAGQQPPHRPRHRRAAAVLLGDPAAVVPQDPKITEVLPLLYLHGLSTGDFGPGPVGARNWAHLMRPADTRGAVRRAGHAGGRC